jgi:hypothetical protein
MAVGNKLAHSAPGAGVPTRKGTKPAIGTTFSFGVDPVSRITFSFHRTSHGSRVGATCVKHTGANASRPRCTHAVSEGTLRVLAPMGRNTLHFEGPISRRTALAPGSYRVAISATSQAENASATRLLLRFTIVTR